MQSQITNFNGSQLQNSFSNSASPGLLINVIRTLTSSVSDDQRELERTRLKKGYEESGIEIDQLLQTHLSDVGECLTTFREVSASMRSCREQIRNVKNALVTCKSLLQCRRDDLKKLWAEAAEQKHLCQILQEIHDIKHIDQKIEKHLNNGQYLEAVNCLKQADILLNGPLSSIDGLTQLRANVSENIQGLFEKIVANLLECIVLVPFECQIIELMKSLSETTLNEAQVCVKLLNKYSSLNFGTSTMKPTTLAFVSQWSNRVSNNESLQFEFNLVQKNNLADEATKTKMIECFEALKVFDQLGLAIENIFTKTPSLCYAAVNDTISVMQLLISDGVGDSSHFAQLTQLLIYQITECSGRFAVFLKELTNMRDDIKKKLAIRFWNILQSVLESVISDHLEILQPTIGNKSRGQCRKTKSLFSFENTTFAVSANSSVLKKQFNLICPANLHNISAVFNILNRFSAKVEHELDGEVCKFSTFLHTFVMDTFIEKIRLDLESKMEAILKSTDFWSSLSLIPAYNVKVLASCTRIFELCEMVNNFIKMMGLYTQQFAALWLLIIASYTKSASDMYLQIIRTRNPQGDNFVECPKISAAWAVDEDISRLLKSLPTWIAIKQCSLQLQSLSLSDGNGLELADLLNGSTAEMLEETGFIDNEHGIRQQTQRESEILIGNLGTQKHIKRGELITDMDHVKSLVSIHESLQWFASSMRALIKNLPERSCKILKCRIQISSLEGGETVEQLLSDALEERLKTLDNMAETCLLMIYLEIRIHCFYHLLPLAQFRSESQEDQDLEIKEFGRDLMQFSQTLSAYIIQKKLKYLFGGLGYLCAAIFIHTSQYINKLSDQDRKQVCRNIYTVQKYLSQLSGKPESEINRALTFYKVVNLDVDQIFAMVKESGESYTYLEYTYLLSLAIRSHPVLSSQPGALEAILSQLRDDLSR